MICYPLLGIICYPLWGIIPTCCARCGHPLSLFFGHPPPSSCSLTRATTVAASRDTYMSRASVISKPKEQPRASLPKMAVRWRVRWQWSTEKLTLSTRPTASKGRGELKSLVDTEGLGELMAKGGRDGIGCGMGRSAKRLSGAHYILQGTFLTGRSRTLPSPIRNLDAARGTRESACLVGPAELWGSKPPLTIESTGTRRPLLHAR